MLPRLESSTGVGIEGARLTIRGDEDQGLVSLRRCGQVPSYSPHRLVRQSAMLLEGSLQG